MTRVRLGPVVGHVDETSGCVWVRAEGAVEDLELRVYSNRTLVSKVPFFSTEPGTPPRKRVFGTGVAVARGLAADRRYQFRVDRSRGPYGAVEGSFRTTPPRGSNAEFIFFSTSCSDLTRRGAWPRLAQWVEGASPRFLLLTGDQVYMDSGGTNVWDEHLLSDSKSRLHAMADKYQVYWERAAETEIFAHVPTYMSWDDHEIRDGWGSRAGDSPALLAHAPRGRAIFQLFDAYFRDARAAYWHFQRCRYPLPSWVSPAASAPALPGHEWPALPSRLAGGARIALPYLFRCGSVAVCVLDGRSERDFFREGNQRVLGATQWSWLRSLVPSLPLDVRALALVTGVPIVSSDPLVGDRALGDYSGDVDAFVQGDLDRLLETFSNSKSLYEIAVQGVAEYKRELVDDVRDGWSGPRNADEQAQLLDLASVFRDQRRLSDPAVSFYGGDIHVGALYSIEDTHSGRSVECAIGSSIGRKPETASKASLVAAERFRLKDGFRVRRTTDVITQNNFVATVAQPEGREVALRNWVEFSGVQGRPSEIDPGVLRLVAPLVGE